MIHVLDMQFGVDEHTVLYPCFRAVPMGMELGPCFFVTKLRCRLPGRVLPGMMAFCVRSVLHHSFRNIILFLGFMLITSPSLARIRMSLIRDARSLRLPSKTRTTWTQHTSVTRLESVGCVLDFDRGVIMNKPSRVWRFASATEALLRRRKVECRDSSSLVRSLYCTVWHHLPIGVCHLEISEGSWEVEIHLNAGRVEAVSQESRCWVLLKHVEWTSRSNLWEWYWRSSWCFDSRTFAAGSHLVDKLCWVRDWISEGRVLVANLCLEHNFMPNWLNH